MLHLLDKIKYFYNVIFNTEFKNRVSSINKNIKNIKNTNSTHGLLKPINNLKRWLEIWPGRVIEFHGYQRITNEAISSLPIIHSTYFQGKITRIISAGLSYDPLVRNPVIIAEVKVFGKGITKAASYDTNPNQNWTGEQYRRKHHKTIYTPGRNYGFRPCEPEIHYVKWCGNRWKYAYEPNPCWKYSVNKWL